MGVGQKALFLDRDGVINHEVGYLHAAEDVRWVEGIFELCRVASGVGVQAGGGDEPVGDCAGDVYGGASLRC